MVARDDDDFGCRKPLSKPLELAEAVNDGLIGGPDRMEEIARDDDQIRLGVDDLPHRLVEDPGDVNLALVEAERGLPVVLAIAEMDIGKVSEQHRENLHPESGFVTRSDYRQDRVVAS